MKDAHINTVSNTSNINNVGSNPKVEPEGAQRLPHERDESPDAQAPRPRSVMQQAASDIERGLVDTDLHNQPGAQTTRAPTPTKAAGTAQPQAGSKRD